MESLTASQCAYPLRLANEHADSCGFIPSQSHALGVRVAQLVASGCRGETLEPPWVGWGQPGRRLAEFRSCLREPWRREPLGMGQGRLVGAGMGVSVQAVRLAGLFSGPRGRLAIPVLPQGNGRCPAELGGVVSGRTLPSSHKLPLGEGAQEDRCTKHRSHPRPHSQHSLQGVDLRPGGHSARSRGIALERSCRGSCHPGAGPRLLTSPGAVCPVGWRWHPPCCCPGHRLWGQLLFQSQLWPLQAGWCWVSHPTSLGLGSFTSSDTERIFV